MAPKAHVLRRHLDDYTDLLLSSRPRNETAGWKKTIAHSQNGKRGKLKAVIVQRFVSDQNAISAACQRGSPHEEQVALIILDGVPLPQSAVCSATGRLGSKQRADAARVDPACSAAVDLWPRDMRRYTRAWHGRAWLPRANANCLSAQAQGTSLPKPDAAGGVTGCCRPFLLVTICSNRHRSTMCVHIEYDRTRQRYRLNHARSTRMTANGLGKPDDALDVDLVGSLTNLRCGSVLKLRDAATPARWIALGHRSFTIVRNGPRLRS